MIEFSRWRVAPLLLALALVFAPMAAQARVGLGQSMGSRGAKTYTPGQGSPMQRSLAPNTGYSYGSGYSGGGYSSGFGGSFGRGFLGGLIGAGIGGMLFGGGFFGGMHGGFGLIGLLVQLYLLYLLGSWIYRRFLVGALLPAGGMPFVGNRPPGGGGGAGYATRAIALAPPDYQSFDKLLHGIQAAWSAHDIAALQNMATPEMVSYFGEQLAEQTSRGVRNQVGQVQLQHGSLAEAWSEGSREYATVAMRFSMIDVTYDRAGHVVDGSPTERVTVTELWTFVRVPGGQWVLSAIQQPR